MTYIEIGVSGSRDGMTPEQWFAAGQVVGEIYKEDPESQIVVHHGDCLGVDEEWADICERYGLWAVVHPPVEDKYRAFTEQRPSVLGVRMKRPFLDRNHDIVDETVRLVAFPSGNETAQPRSGTWATVRYATKTSKPVLVVYPDGTKEER